jgi:hypothetical protein
LPAPLPMDCGSAYELSPATAASEKGGRP